MPPIPVHLQLHSYTNWHSRENASGHLEELESANISTQQRAWAARGGKKQAWITGCLENQYSYPAPESLFH